MQNPFHLPARAWGFLGLTTGVVALISASLFFSIRAARRTVAPPPPVAGHGAAVARGRAYLGQSRPDLALESVSMVRDERPGAGEAMTVAGLALIQLREYRAARMALERAVKLQPGQLDATKALAALQLRMGNGVRGIELLEAVARLDPGDAQTWLTMGKVYHDLGDPSKAAGAFEEALRRDPKEPDALVGLISDLLNSNRAEEATPRVAESLRRWPGHPTFLGLAARQARETGRLDEAVDLATRALKAEPDNLHALMVRARTRVAAGHPEEALADLEHAVATHPSDPGALQLLAQVEARLGLAERSRATSDRHRKATDRAMLMDELTRQIAQRPDDPEPRWRMGKAAAEGGSTQLAAQCFQAALALDPTYQAARESLAALGISGREAAPRPLEKTFGPPQSLR